MNTGGENKIRGKEKWAPIFTNRPSSVVLIQGLDCVLREPGNGVIFSLKRLVWGGALATEERVFTSFASDCVFV